MAGRPQRGSPVLLGDRTLAAATVVSVDGEQPYDVQRALAAAMCSDPLPVSEPVVGCNNWYYAYGVDFGPDQVVRDAETIVEYADGHAVRPYCVVDAGWNLGGVCPGGPWTHGVPGLFDDMLGLAASVAETGARPGIWVRPAALSFVDDPARLRPGPDLVREKPLDLTRADNLATIGQDVARLVGWGFELIKHDFLDVRHVRAVGACNGPGDDRAGLVVRRPEPDERGDPAGAVPHDPSGAGLRCRDRVQHGRAWGGIALVEVQRTGDDSLSFSRPSVLSFAALGPLWLMRYGCLRAGGRLVWAGLGADAADGRG